MVVEAGARNPLGLRELPLGALACSRFQSVRMALKVPSCCLNPQTTTTPRRVIMSDTFPAPVGPLSGPGSSIVLSDGRLDGRATKIGGIDR